MSQVSPIQHELPINDITMTYFEWGVEHKGKDSPILLVHATGFHARCWDKIIPRLGERYVIAVDQRGHGRSTASEEPTHWSMFGDDLKALITALDLTDIVGVGHSMGGHALTQASAQMNERFQRLLLVDPVIGSPEFYRPENQNNWQLKEGEKHPVAKRRNEWASPDAMFERFKDRSPYSLWQPEILQDYCEYGLLPNPNGEGYVLACSPDFEASIYMANFGNSAIHEYVHQVQVPVMILRAKLPPPNREKMDFSVSPTWPALVNEYADAHERYLPETTHFIPMQDPDLVVRHILTHGG